MCSCDSLLCLRSSSIDLNCRWHSKHWNEIGSPCANSGSSKAETGTGEALGAGETAPAEPATGYLRDRGHTQRLATAWEKGKRGMTGSISIRKRRMNVLEQVLFDW